MNSTDQSCENCLKLNSKVFACSTDALALMAPEGHYLGQNHFHRALFGHSDTALRAWTPEIHFGPSAFSDIQKNLAKQGTFRSELNVKPASGPEKQIELSILSIKDGQGKTLCYLLTHHEITRRKSTDSHRADLPNHDPLTGLPNQRLLADRFAQAIKVAERKGRKLALLYIDIDFDTDFEQANRFKGTLNPRSGQDLLVTLAGRLKNCVRDCDTVVRFSRDTFVILLTESSEIEHAATISSKILHRIAQPVLLETQPLVLSANIGISLFPADGSDSTSLIDHAQRAMSRVKNQKKNSYQFYSKEVGPRTLERIELKLAIQQAIDSEAFQVYYQPQINLETGKTSCVEALLRWPQANKGLLLPSAFIPMAEETGLIIALDTWVLRTACRQLKLWQDGGFPDLRVAVNLSAIQFQQQDLCPLVDEMLAETGIDPDTLELELTESITMSDIDQGMKTMQGLDRLGVRIAVDDFGVGYSSLGYLRQFPIHTLKIDQSFIRGLCDNSDDAAITAAIIAMAQNLNLEVVAEGVETKEQLAFLRSHHCNNMQGFYFSPPLTADALGDFLSQSRKFDSSEQCPDEQSSAIDSSY